VKITEVTVIPLAFRDPPLLNSWGVHEPLALRSLVRVVVDDSVVAWGEGSGEASVLTALTDARDCVIGRSPFELGRIEQAMTRKLAAGGRSARDIASAFAIIEVACHDAQGKLAGVPVAELLGGRVRDTVPYSAYLFFKWAGHPGADGQIETDAWGAALDPESVVAQARTLIGRFGFRSIKLKAGVFPPEIEIATIHALAAAFPGMPLRIDPNGGWTLDTSLRIADALAGELEYLEDPTLNLDDLATIAKRTGLPIATNMVVTSFDTIRPAVDRGAVQVVLADHHYWGGLRNSRELAKVCESFGLGLSMHSNSHLGISLAAMTHLAAATPNLGYACDTHYPWNCADDVVAPGSIRFTDGAMAVPTTPGLGVEIDEGKVAELHELYVSSGRTTRDDTGYMRRVDRAYDPSLPRF
jgi:glucarate dehydratase